MKFISSNWDKKFEREDKEIIVEKEYRKIAQRIQNGMNKYVAVVEVEKKNAQLKKENEQKLREKEKEAELLNQRIIW
ncbi:MAG: hypothetical protein GXP45_03025 [bacterium]|nr:hypothetical protein [bacterium]